MGDEDQSSIRSDPSSVFTVPNELVERITLKIQETCTGQRSKPCFVSIAQHSGRSNNRKKDLINELVTRIAKQAGVAEDGSKPQLFFVSGCHEQRAATRPLSGISQAFEELMKQLLREEAIVAKTRKSLASGMDVQTVNRLVDTFPELGRLFPDNSRARQWSHEESRAEAIVPLQTFFRCVGNANQSLVVALDDVQWADQDTLDTIKSLVTNNSIKGLVLIVSYRFQEVDRMHPRYPFQVHPFQMLMDELSGRQCNMLGLSLGDCPEAGSVQTPGVVPNVWTPLLLDNQGAPPPEAPPVDAVGESTIEPPRPHLRNIEYSMHLEFDNIPIFEREKELDQLKEWFEATCITKQNKSAFVSISGYSGVGKTTLLGELSKYIVDIGEQVVNDGRGDTSTRLFFTWGKYEQIRSSVPFSAIGMALETLVEELLVEELQNDLTTLRQEIAKGMDRDLARLLVGTFPVLVPLFRGHISQEDSQVARSQRGRQEVHSAFQAFFRCISNSRQSLVLALDDMQWADTESLDVIGAIFNDSRIKGLLLVATYRSNEVDENHGLQKLVNELQQRRCDVKNMSLESLSIEGLNKVIRHVLKRTDTDDCDDTTKLTESIHGMTDGNVFSSLVVLRVLEETDYITYSPEKGYFLCTAAAVQAADLHGDVVNLVVERIKQFSPEMQRVLSLGSCLGTNFKKSMVVGVMTEDSDSTEHADAISKAFDTLVSKGLLRRDDATSDRYRFSHDRIVQAAYDLLKEGEEKEREHLQIGRHLCKSTDLLLLSTSQMNKGSNLIVKKVEKLKLVRMNLEAASLAKEKSSFEQGVDYAMAGISLCAEYDPWSAHYRTSLRLHLILSEMLYFMGRYDELDKTLDVLFKNTSQDHQDSYRASQVKINSLISRDELPKAINYGVKVLSKVGYHLSPRPRMIAVVLEVMRIKAILRSRSLEKWAKMKKMKHPRKLFVMKIMTHIANASYSSNKPELMIMAMLRSLRVSLECARASRYTAVNLGWYATVLGGMGNVEESYMVGADLAMKLATRFNSKEVTGIFNNTYYTTVHHIRHPVKDFLHIFLESFGTADQVGDMIQAVNSAGLYCNCSIYCGIALDSIVKNGEHFRAKFKNFGQKNIQAQLYIGCQWALNISGQNTARADGAVPDPFKLDGDAFKAEDLQAYVNEGNGNAVVVYAYFCQMLFYILDPDHSETKTNFDKLHKLDLDIVTKTVNLHLPPFAFYAALTGIWFHRRGSLRYRRTWIRYLKLLRNWEEHEIPSLSHKIALLEAERMSFGSNRPPIPDIKKQYEEAIDLACENGFRHECAIAKERYGEFLARERETSESEKYLEEALRMYAEWGAKAKVEIMCAKHHCLARVDPPYVEPSEDSGSYLSGEDQMMN